ncbi:hypothetical protein SAMN04488556_0237 [Halostagnicola kamekurae]|uniref:Uncharacterized protein n=1 Tax=Halostagnicola kamekurae TaxID=619731 RepID=A0A1I6P045_9EURY|nr:hypothetical protein SAMN04488556_0237 [Halostagnicola kamekurae]
MSMTTDTLPAATHEQLVGLNTVADVLRDV